MKKLIGITGKAGAGKDTFAKYFRERGFKRIAFADVLKDITATLANEDVAMFHDIRTKEDLCPALGMTRRRAMQMVGQGLREALGPDVWWRYALGKWMAEGMPPAVITDVRYDNEAKAILDIGGLVVSIERPASVLLDGAAAAHSSEAGVSEELITVGVLNDGTVGELMYEASKILKAYLPEVQWPPLEFPEVPRD